MIKLKLSVPIWRVMFGLYKTVEKTSALGKKQFTKAAKNVKKVSKKVKQKVETNIRHIKMLSKSTETFNPLISHASPQGVDEDSEL